MSATARKEPKRAATVAGSCAAAIRRTGLALVVAGCATTAPYNPFQIPEEEFRAKVKRVALAPVAVPRELGVSDATKVRIDALIEAKMQEAGFVTYPASHWGRAMARLEQESGGVFDPRSGQRDEKKLKALWQSLHAEMRRQFEFDAVLLPTVVVVRAGWNRNYANWDGVSEPLSSGVSALLAPAAQGTLPALSLMMSMGPVNPEGDSLYRHRGGIHVLEKLTPLGERMSGLFKPIPPEAILADEERIRGAIDVSLGALLKKP